MKYSQGIIDAFHLLGCRQEALERTAGQQLGPTFSATRRKRSALKASLTKASKAFARECHRAGFEDAQAVADALTKAEQHPPQPEPEAENFVAEVNGHKIYRMENGYCSLWTAGVGWWGFYLSEEDARSTCQAVAAPAPTKACPECGAALEKHEGAISEPVVRNNSERGHEPERLVRPGVFWACPSCEHCEEVIE